MKKAMSIILSLALVWAFAIVPASAAPASAAPTAAVNYAALTPNEKLVCDYWNSINTGNWNAWVSYYTPSLQPEYRDLVSNGQNEANNIGILAVKRAQVLSINRISNSMAPRYPELQAFYNSNGAYQCYAVGVNLTTKQDNKYFHNGVSYHLVTLVNQNGQWGIGGLAGCPDNVTANSYLNRGIGQGFIDLIPEPSTINVKDERGTLHQDVDFTDFVVNVTCNEIGTRNFNDEAIKAQAMAAKMFGWWAVAGQYREALGCDIKYGDVAYRSGLRTTSDQTAHIEDVVAEVDGDYFVSGDETGGRLFSTNYVAGSYSSYGKHSGIMRQNGANYLANKQGYDWMDILHYFYDASHYNNPGVGATIQIF